MNKNDKENQSKSKRLPRTKKEQFELILEFLKDNNEALLDGDVYHQLWIELVNKLNAIGPPTHSIAEWKRVWSEHRYNKKRKRLDTEGSSLPAKKTAQNTILDQTQNQSTEIPTNISTVNNIKESIAYDPQKSIEWTVEDTEESITYDNAQKSIDSFSDFIVQLPTLSDETVYSACDFLSSSDCFSNALTDVSRQISATSDVLCTFQPAHSAFS